LTALTLSPSIARAARHTVRIRGCSDHGKAFIVGIFYSLDALYGERRDRSILFWKSLPVSDLTTVLSKFTIPLIVLPLLSFAIAVVTQFVILLLTAQSCWAAAECRDGLGADIVLPHVTDAPLPHADRHGLWYAPIYGWLLLVSLGTTRAVYMGVPASLRDLGSREIAFRTSHFLGMLQYA